MRFLGRVLGLTISAFLFVATAHGAASPQRILQQIDPTSVTELPGNVSVQARRAVDLGAAPEDLALTELSLRFTMTAAQQSALTQLLNDQQNPDSPRYHQWLTPEEFGAQFGLAAADLQKVTTWLSSQGFTVTEVARGGLLVRFAGTVGQVENSFHTRIHRVTLDGESHVTNLTDPEIPTAIAAVTGSISGLHDFKLKPHYRRMSVTSDATQSGVESISATPHYTSAASGNHFIAPGDFYTIYDVNPLLTGGTTGTGIKIAVVGQTDVILSDIATFRSLGGLPVNPPTIVLASRDPGTSTNDQVEAELDLEWSGATAPGASIIYVNSTNAIDGSLTYAITNNLAPIISVSYGECETAVGVSTLNSYLVLTQQANAQGQTIVSAAGDSGATDCDNSVASASQGLVADFPAVLPNVTGIGGTMFNDTPATSYWTATNGANMGSALSYVPEGAWNEDAAGGGLSSGGGGVSTFFTKPFWQKGTGVPADSSRDVPDISFNAALLHDAYLICTPGYCTDGYKNSSGSHDIVGGTSVGAPSFAGLMALLEQKIGSRVGNANPKIYALANSAFYSSVFHDTTTGTNASPCTAGTTNCPAGGSIGYAAGVGYDLATGWGSLDVFNFVTNWNSVTAAVSTIGQTPSTTTLAGLPTAVTQGTSVTLTATVGSGTASNTTTPTGTVQFLVDNVATGTPVALVAGKATMTLSTTGLASGARAIQAAYSGDTTFAGSKGSFTLAVTSSGVPDFTITPATASVTVASNSSSTGTVLTVTGLNSFTGTVSLTATAVSGSGYSFSPTSISLTNTKTAGTSTFTFLAYKLNAQTGTSASLKPSSPPWYGAGSGLALAGVLMLVLPKRRRFMGALVAVLSIGMFAVSGCGGGGSAGGGGAGSGTTTGTTPGTYSVTVTATGTSGATTATHTAVVTVIVQ